MRGGGSGVLAAMLVLLGVGWWMLGGGSSHPAADVRQIDACGVLDREWLGASGGVTLQRGEFRPESGFAGHCSVLDADGISLLVVALATDSSLRAGRLASNVKRFAGRVQPMELSERKAGNPALQEFSLDSRACRGVMLVAPESSARRSGFLMAADGGVLLMLDVHRNADPDRMETICTGVLAVLRR